MFTYQKPMLFHRLGLPVNVIIKCMQDINVNLDINCPEGLRLTIQFHLDCTKDAGTSDCALPITLHQTNSGAHFEKYNAWSAGDNYLDWYGAEAGQGSYQGEAAEGTPSVWTTNKVGETGYNSLNTYALHKSHCTSF